MTEMTESVRVRPDGQSRKQLVYADTGETQYERIKRLLKEYKED